MPNIKSIKQKLRDDMRGVLRDYSVPDAALRARDQFLQHFKNLDPKLIIAGTSPIKHEISPIPLLDALAKKGHPLCLPITRERAAPLIFRQYCIGDALVTNSWGIQTPDETAPECAPDILICPMLAFDRRGGRLGYGGGYYDATLQSLRRHKPILAIGLAYAVQEVDTIPLGKYDERLDAIVTENEVIIANGQG